VGAIVPDPGITFGSFRVLQRTDQVWIVIDERRPIGKRTVRTFPAGNGKKDATAVAEELWRNDVKEPH
jgi:hypothetical protein